jgi:hypothetical protein
MGAGGIMNKLGEGPNEELARKHEQAAQDHTDMAAIYRMPRQFQRVVLVLMNDQAPRRGR